MSDYSFMKSGFNNLEETISMTQTISLLLFFILLKMLHVLLVFMLNTVIEILLHLKTSNVV